jgi:hypothetical protein
LSAVCEKKLIFHLLEITTRKAMFHHRISELLFFSLCRWRNFVFGLEINGTTKKKKETHSIHEFYHQLHPLFVEFFVDVHEVSIFSRQLITFEFTFRLREPFALESSAAPPNDLL